MKKDTVQKHNKYLVLLADRKNARMFTLQKGVAGQHEEIVCEDVPQKVRHGDDTWDSQDKIFRHIEDHLRRHLECVGQQAKLYVEKNNIDRILIGSHKPLFGKIKKNLQYPLSQKVVGTFVTELKIPFGEILNRAKIHIAEIEGKEKSIDSA